MLAQEITINSWYFALFQNNVSEPLPSSNWTKDELLQHYSQCIKLSQENKINVRFIQVTDEWWLYLVSTCFCDDKFVAEVFRQGPVVCWKQKIFMLNSLFLQIPLYFVT